MMVCAGLVLTALPPAAWHADAAWRPRQAGVGPALPAALPRRKASPKQRPGQMRNNGGLRSDRAGVAVPASGRGRNAVSGAFFAPAATRFLTLPIHTT